MKTFPSCNQTLWSGCRVCSSLFYINFDQFSKTIIINLSPALENGGNPFNMLGGMGSNMTQQLAGLMGMQGMGMPSMVSSSYILFFFKACFFQGGMGGGMPMNNSQLSSMWGGMPGRSMGSMGSRGMMEVCTFNS